jgi:ribosomal protein L30E
MEKLKEDLLNKGNKLVFGTDRSIKLLKNDKLERIYLAGNCKEDVKESVNHYKGETEIVELKEMNDEIGVVCKKQFSISVIGLSK